MTLREELARAIQSADDGFGYRIRLARLVGDDATYTLDYQDGSPILEFASHSDAAEHTAMRRQAVRADALLPIIEREVRAARVAEREACAAIASERAAICFDARDKIKAGELYARLPREATAATEQCAGVEAVHIATAILNRTGSKADG